MKNSNYPLALTLKQSNWSFGLCFIQLGNPQQNAYIERFNRTVRYGWLSHYIYRDIEEL